MANVPPQQIPVFDAQVQFMAGPTNLQIERIEIAGIPHLKIVLRTAQSATGTIWSIDSARQIADKIYEESGPGLQIVRDTILDPRSPA